MIPFIVFNIFVLALLVLDLAVFHRKAHQIELKEALLWSGFWILLALVFNLGLWWFKGPDTALRFLTGYLLEKSLSVDNLFVFLLIFNFFNVPQRYQHRVLFWGIVGALIFRALFIFTGIVLIRLFEWVFYIFGAILIYSGVKLFVEQEKEILPERNPVLRAFRKFVPVTRNLHGDQLVVREPGRLAVTPLFVVLLVIETTDVVFAVDSIPAILAITVDPFIVYTSNVFAILGLRALYFALAGTMQIFHFLHYGLGALLVFIGVKMCLHHFVEIPIFFTLVAIAATLAVCIFLSIIFPERPEPQEGE